MLTRSDYQTFGQYHYLGVIPYTARTHTARIGSPPNGLFAVRHVRANIHHFARGSWEITGRNAPPSRPRTAESLFASTTSRTPTCPGMTPRAMDTAREVSARLSPPARRRLIHLVWVRIRRRSSATTPRPTTTPRYSLATPNFAA